MPDCSHCGRFINTSAAGWMCHCPGERAATAEREQQSYRPPKLPKPRITWDGRLKAWQCSRALATYSGFGATPLQAYEHFRTNNRP